MHHWGMRALLRQAGLPHAAAARGPVRLVRTQVRSPTASRRTRRPAQGPRLDRDGRRSSGCAISIVLGMPLAVADGPGHVARALVCPYLVALQAIPILAIVPLIGSIFGCEFGTRILVCVMISIFPIVTNTLFGLHVGRQRPARPVHAAAARRAGPGCASCSSRPRCRRSSPASASPPACRSSAPSSASSSSARASKPGIGIVMDAVPLSRPVYPQIYGALLLVVAARHRRVLLLRLARASSSSGKLARADPSPR